MITRAFNQITKKDGLIYKSSENLNKLTNEYLWLKEIKKIPELKGLSPAKLKFQDNTLVMKDYGDSDLGYWYIQETSEQKVFQEINKLFEILQTFWAVDTSKFSQRVFPKNFYLKTFNNRLAKLPPEIKNSSAIWRINGKEVNWKQQVANLQQKLLRYPIVPLKIVHGDFILSNILKTQQGYKLIDPRGSFDSDFTILGDPYYDLAKLRSSIVSGHEFIIHNLSSLEGQLNRNEINFKLNFKFDINQVREFFDLKVLQLGFNLEQVLLLEKMLILNKMSMHPLNEALQFFGTSFN